MLRLNLLQRKFIKIFLTKLTALPAFWFFFRAIYPLFRYPLIDPAIYVMMSLFDWICLTLTFFASAILDAATQDPSLRQALKNWVKSSPPKISPVAKEPDTKKKEEKLPLF